MICAVFAIMSSGCATKLPASALVSLPRESVPPPCLRPSLPTDGELAAMAGWKPAQWARYAFEREATHEGALALCEADRDRLWARGEALNDAIDDLRGRLK
jgi:hypothetical protein